MDQQLLLGIFAGAATYAATGYIYYGRNLAKADGYLEKLMVYGGASTNIRVAIYSDVSTLPNTLLLETGSVAVVSGFNEIVLPSRIAVLSGTYYWIGAQTQGASGFGYLDWAGDQAQNYAYGVFPASASPFANAFRPTIGCFGPRGHNFLHERRGRLDINGVSTQNQLLT